MENDTIDCIWGSFSMDGREEEYQWAGPYLHSRQVVAVRSDSDIRTLQDLADKVVAVQSTTKPEELFLNAEQNGLPRLRRLYSLQNRDLLYTTLLKGYADALAAHESAIRQFMKDYSVEYRILDEPLMTARLGVAFAKERGDDLPQQLTEVFSGDAGRWHRPADREPLSGRPRALSGWTGGQYPCMTEWKRARVFSTGSSSSWCGTCGTVAAGRRAGGFGAQRPAKCRKAV